MTPVQLAELCRCGHARRFHQQGTIWQAYDTRCLKAEHGGDYSETGCLFFERDAQALVLRRDSRGRFRRLEASSPRPLKTLDAGC